MLVYLSGIRTFDPRTTNSTILGDADTRAQVQVSLDEAVLLAERRLK